MKYQQSPANDSVKNTLKDKSNDFGTLKVGTIFILTIPHMGDNGLLMHRFFTR